MNPSAHRDLIVQYFDAMSADRERAFQAKCDDYDTKPVELPRLLQKIEGLLSR